MNVLLVGSLATAIVIILGVASTLPAFLQSPKLDSKTQVILSFSLIDDKNPRWCNDLAGLLQRDQVKASVFITGSVAVSNPNCVSLLASNKNLDIGSQTYNFRNLTSILDYSEALKEVSSGKKAVDIAGNIDTKSFRAPYGSTDQNIYSYLNRSGIIADFSYSDHYNKYQNSLFVRYESASYNSTDFKAKLLSGAEFNQSPIFVELDNYSDIKEISDFLSAVKTSADVHGHEINLINGSDLIGESLTIRTNTEGGSS